MQDLTPSKPGSRRALVVLIAGVSVIGSNSLVLSPLLTDVSSSLNAAPTMVVRATAAYGGATAIAAVMLSGLVARFGERRALTLGLLLVALGALLSAFASHWTILTFGQGVAGIGAGLALPATYALAGAVAAPGCEARTLGQVLTGWSLSMVAGVPIAALAASAFGWRVPFTALSVLAMLAAAGAGSLPARAAPGDATDDAHVATTHVLGDPTVRALLLVCFAFMTAFYGVYAFLGDHLRNVLSVGTAAAGIPVLAYGVGFALASVADGFIDRIGLRRSFPAILAGVGTLYLVIEQAAVSLAAIVTASFAWGFVNHLGLTILVVLLSGARPTQRPAVLGLNSAVTYLGAMAGAAGAAPIYERYGLATLAQSAAGLLFAAAALALATGQAERRR